MTLKLTSINNQDFSRKFGTFGLLGLEEYTPRALDSYVLRKAPPATQGCRLYLYLRKRLAWHSVPICLVKDWEPARNERSEQLHWRNRMLCHADHWNFNYHIFHAEVL